jgi:hypothetical protein
MFLYYVVRYEQIVLSGNVSYQNKNYKTIKGSVTLDIGIYLKGYKNKDTVQRKLRGGGAQKWY